VKDKWYTATLVKYERSGIIQRYAVTGLNCIFDRDIPRKNQIFPIESPDGTTQDDSHIHRTFIHYSLFIIYYYDYCYYYSYYYQLHVHPCPDNHVVSCRFHRSSHKESRMRTFDFDDLFSPVRAPAPCPLCCLHSQALTPGLMPLSSRARACSVLLTGTSRTVRYWSSGTPCMRSTGVDAHAVRTTEETAAAAAAKVKLSSGTPS
jgi:hypothetical protein